MFTEMLSISLRKLGEDSGNFRENFKETVNKVRWDVEQKFGKILGKL